MNVILFRTCRSRTISCPSSPGSGRGERNAEDVAKGGDDVCGVDVAECSFSNWTPASSIVGGQSRPGSGRGGRVAGDDVGSVDVAEFVGGALIAFFDAGTR